MGEDIPYRTWFITLPPAPLVLSGNSETALTLAISNNKHCGYVDFTVAVENYKVRT